MNELINVQQELKAPKGQYNSFGKYRYRSCEDILESVKPILTKYGCTLTISDDLVIVGSRIYVKATATFKDADGKETSTTAFAREPETKKGMDDSQITGTASSYARKYALNGLFLIDDTKDADTDEYKNQQETKQAEEAKVTDAMITSIRMMLLKAGKSEQGMLDYMHRQNLSDLTTTEYRTMMDMLEKWASKKEARNE